MPSTGSTAETVKPKGQASLKKAIFQGTASERKSKQWTVIKNAVTIHQCKDIVMLQTVRKDGFRAKINIVEGENTTTKLLSQHNSNTVATTEKNNMHICICLTFFWKILCIQGALNAKRLECMEW